MDLSIRMSDGGMLFEPEPTGEHMAVWTWNTVSVFSGDLHNVLGHKPGFYWSKGISVEKAGWYVA